MFCSQCGKELPKGASACPNCGAKVEKEINFSDVTNYANQKAQQVSDGIQNKMEHYRQARSEAAENRKIKNVGDVFVDPEEQQRAVIGDGYLSNLLRSGMLGTGFGILTNRRMYFRGKCYSKVNGHFVKTDEDRTIDVQDITSSGFSYTRSITWMVLMIISLLLSFFCFIEAESSYADEPMMFALFFLAAAIVCLVLYLLKKFSIYTVTFGGGSLSIRADSYGLDAVRAFDKVLHQVKDEFLKDQNI